MSYDPACEDLARHFLSDLAREELVERLAEYIQGQIEDWIAYEIQERRLPAGNTP
jgi:hypothetical protein